MIKNRLFCNNKASLVCLNKFTLMFSYETLIAWNDGTVWYRAVKDDDISRVISTTTSRHIKELFLVCGLSGVDKKTYLKHQYKEFEF